MDSPMSEAGPGQARNVQRAREQPTWVSDHTAMHTRQEGDPNG